jgi:secreted protein with Ig-like and vWFA domain
MEGVPATRQSELQGMAAKPESFGGETERGEKLRHRPAPGLPMPPRFIPPHPGNEVSGDSFAAIIENPLREVSADPLSTFSIDVDTASYAIVRRYLNQGRVPPSDAVRLEELINYFPYDYPQPEGDSPFAVNVEINQAPWKKAHRLARIGIKGTIPPVEKRQSANLVFLLDVSGSMSDDNKLPLLKQSLRLLIDRLDENDRVSLVTYAGHSGVALPPTHGHQKARILDVLDQLQAGGSTDGASGIEEAYRLAKESFVKGGVNRVILATDGDFNVGITDQEKLVELIQQKARDGVFLSVLGFGEGNLKDSTMELLANKGNGNYAYIDALGEARKVLVEQMGGTLVTIAKDVKIQVEFNPAVIRSYRLIGYENRMLAKEDFNDDKKDAGEIGAGHTVTALYELIPVHAAPGAEDDRPAIDALKYQKVPAPALTDEAAKGEAFTLKLRYKAPDGDESRLLEIPVTDSNAVLDKASPEFQFSTAVAGFGLMLRDSSYKGELDWDVVRNLALQGKGPDPFGYRGEFLQLIDKARGLLQTKDQ